jgi:hypothetical protein
MGNVLDPPHCGELIDGADEYRWAIAEDFVVRVYDWLLAAN